VLFDTISLIPGELQAILPVQWMEKRVAGLFAPKLPGIDGRK
jgi:hypothetical protein